MNDEIRHHSERRIMSFLGLDEDRSNHFAIVRGAKLDPAEERKEWLARFANGAPCSFLVLLQEVSSGKVTVEEFDKLLPHVVRYEKMDESELCTHLLEQLQREPRRAANVSPEISARLNLGMSMAQA